ncbi:MAG: hypothetical protein A2075_14000 [Geobacteraceae bacterium GWC2_58_44]|nr:MAG: hypothetical protein A2075_14000 [Geobacteraceae bacterium GWC2_58_44]
MAYMELRSKRLLPRQNAPAISQVRSGIAPGLAPPDLIRDDHLLDEWCMVKELWCMELEQRGKMPGSH